ncbi:MAG: GDSL-type esterase/lipase family protein [Microbacter sp.]
MKLRLFLLFALVSQMFVSAHPLIPYYKQGTTPLGFEQEINEFIKSDSVQKPPTGATLFVGSSSIRLWHGLPDDFKGHAVIQRGFGGSNMQALNCYIHNLVFPYKPSVIIVYEGDNDLAEGVTPASFIAQCDSFIRMVHQKLPQTTIYFLSIKPSIAREKLIPIQDSLNGLLQRHLKTIHHVGFIDVSRPMFDKTGHLRTDLFGPDGLHMNRKGYLLWIAVIKKSLGWK